MNDDYKERLEAKLRPGVVRMSLGFVGLFFLIHQAVAPNVVEQVRSFYMVGFDETGMRYDEPRYREQVSSLDKNKFRASALWLVSGNATTLEDVDVLDRAFAHRNDLGHELLKYVVDVDHDPDVQLLADTIEILKKISRFWAQIEMDVGSSDHIEGDWTIDDVVSAEMNVL